MNFDQAADIIKNWKTSERRLPPDFDWSTRKEGYTLSGAVPLPVLMPLLDLAINTGYPLPDDYALWSQRIERLDGGWFNVALDKRIVKGDSASTRVAHWAAEYGYPFPASFPFWDLKNARRRMVIEVFLGCKYLLPPDFYQWRLRSEISGKTVAHMYLRELGRPMPAGFDQWSLTNRVGSTVAHEAVLVAYDLGNDAIGALPPDRSIWLLERRDRDTGENDGNTALHLRAALGGSIPDIFTLEDWHLRNPREKSVIDLARENGQAQLVAQYEALKMRSEIEGMDRPVSRQRIVRGER